MNAKILFKKISFAIDTEGEVTCVEMVQMNSGRVLKITMLKMGIIMLMIAMTNNDDFPMVIKSNDDDDDCHLAAPIIEKTKWKQSESESGNKVI